jgi:hypothetical protein
MPTYVYPTNSQLSQIDQVQLPTLLMDDPVFRHFPVRNKDTHVIIWDQKDNFLGLQQVRGLNGEPARVRRIGDKRYVMEPGVYGEFTQVDEQEIVTRRAPGSYNLPVNVTDLVRECQDQLRHRLVMRIRKILWDLLALGSFTVLGPRGSVLHRDGYTQRTSVSTVAWSTTATATPLSDFRSIQLLGRGYGTSFGSDSIAYMNRKTANYLLSNTNAADLYGRRSSGLSTLNTLELVNQLFMGEGLPQVYVHDGGYHDDSGVFQLFIPDNYVVVIGRRENGAVLGQFTMTRNASNPGQAPGPYSIVTEKPRPPKTITVDYGFNGGPELSYPGSIVVMRVG